MPFNIVIVLGQKLKCVTKARKNVIIWQLYIINARVIVLIDYFNII